MNALLLWAGDRLYWFPPQGPTPESFPIATTPGEVARLVEAGLEDHLPRPLKERLEPARGETVQAGDAVAARILTHAGIRAVRPTVRALRTARSVLERNVWASGRPIALALGERMLNTSLASPEEVLISLAREEERVERSLVRESGAWDQWVTGPSTTLQEYQAGWEEFRRVLDAHHESLEGRLEAQAVRVAPNLSSVVGPRVAARLIAAGGGLARLARMSAGRLQLLGSRRRPGTGRGPRFGVLIRAEGMGSIPPDRQGAYARSLAALAVIAARADALTQADLRDRLRQRKERRAADLARSRDR